MKGSVATLIKDLYQFIKVLLPFLEIIFLGFLINFGVGNSATAIIITIIMLLTTYKWPNITRPVGWFVALLLWFYVIFPNDTFSNFLRSGIAGVARYAIIRFFKI